jgi:tRNA-splicing ligase RtcB (3'-phosphate/5'-hydroxy nucleic acid ligase)
MLENSSSLASAPVLGKQRVPVQFITAASSPVQPQQVAALTALADIPGMVRVVALPDLHLKPGLEAPSSMVAALRDTLVLGLSSPSPNCGMTLAVTGLHRKDLSKRRLDDLFSALSRRLPLSPASPSLSAEEVRRILVSGAPAVLDKYALDPKVLNYMEQGGSALKELPDAEQAVREAVPPALIEAGRWRFGQVGRGNHFLELQVVDQLVNPALGRAWGLEEGQLVVMYHADSGLLGALVGRTYAHRMKNSWRGRLYEWQVKLPFHLRRGSPARLFHRLYYHLLPRRFALLPAGSEEGRRAWTALQAAANYAYANRLAVLAALAAGLGEVFGPSAASSLLWDSPHNSIRPEDHQGETVWVHRHNAARAVPPSRMASTSPFAGTGHPVLLPGTERSTSFLCAAGEGAGQSLHSVDHGTGRAALRQGHRLPGGQVTRVYGYNGGPPELRRHFSAAGSEDILAVLEEHDIVRRVASLRPLAVLKG